MAPSQRRRAARGHHRPPAGPSSQHCLAGHSEPGRPPEGEDPQARFEARRLRRPDRRDPQELSRHARLAHVPDRGEARLRRVRGEHAPQGRRAASAQIIRSVPPPQRPARRAGPGRLGGVRRHRLRQRPAEAVLLRHDAQLLAHEIRRVLPGVFDGALPARARRRLRGFRRSPAEPSSATI